MNKLRLRSESISGTLSYDPVTFVVYTLSLSETFLFIFVCEEFSIYFSLLLLNGFLCL